MKPVLMLSGPIGAGKSTVARELVASAADPVVWIEGDTFWSFIARTGPSQSRFNNFKTVMAAMTAAAVPYALAEYEVILDFSIPPWFLKTASTIVKLKNLPLDYVVLLPGQEVCAARAAVRQQGTIADYTPYRELYKDFAEAQPYTIRDDSSNAKTLAARIREGLKAGTFRIS